MDSIVKPSLNTPTERRPAYQADLDALYPDQPSQNYHLADKLARLFHEKPEYTKVGEFIKSKTGLGAIADMVNIVAKRTFTAEDIVGDKDIHSKAQEAIEAKQILASMKKDFNINPTTEQNAAPVSGNDSTRSCAEKNILATIHGKAGSSDAKTWADRQVAEVTEKANSPICVS